MKLKLKQFASILFLSLLMVVPSIPVSKTGTETDFEQLSTREKLIQMAGKVPDHFCVILEDGDVEVSEAEFYEIADQLKNGTFDPAKYRSRISIS